MPKDRNYRLIAAILREMDRQGLSTSKLADRLQRSGFRSWTSEHLVLRLGELLPVTSERPAGGRYPLGDRELVELATGLRVEVDDLVGVASNG